MSANTRSAAAADPGPPPTAGPVRLAALDRIDPLARRAVELAYFGGLQAAEISELLGRLPADVRALLRHGLLELRVAPEAPATESLEAG